ncbi:MAG: NIPSNAP family protein [Verrucomicrobia bacterium]|nr:NIPSNAP family protein [Verrucomicrobiota bacterium]
MNPNRRTFLKTSLVTSASVALTSVAPAAAAATPRAGREFYELRSFRLKAGASRAPIEGYLEKALLPALGKRGVKNVGVFTEVDVNKNAGTSTPKADTPVWVLIPHPTLESFVSISADINQDPAVQKAGADYLKVPKASPAFDRIDSWLLLAFKGMPQLALPAFSKTKTPTRIFEMRDYESHSELMALSKMAMFDNGEISVMRDLGMSPVFFGQALAGPNLPHLRYITSGSDLATHLANWKKFGPDPRWIKLKDDPQYANNTSKNTARFLVPAACSQI